VHLSKQRCVQTDAGKVKVSDRRLGRSFLTASLISPTHTSKNTSDSFIQPEIFYCYTIIAPVLYRHVLEMCAKLTAQV